MKRREFLSYTLLGTCSFSALVPRHVFALQDGSIPSGDLARKPLRFAVIADLHQDVMHDGRHRLETFLADAQARDVDAIIQLGDLAVPSAANQPVIDLFEQAGPHVIHVIGNHDTDNGYTFQQVLESWKMPARHGVHDLGLIRVIVLDGNVRPPNHSGGYPAHIGPQQLEWLSAELARTNAPPAIILCHQPLAGPWSVDDAADVQRAISAAGDQVLCVLNGHSHIDYVLRVDGVTYVHINSASYQWVGGDHRHASYEEPVHAQYPSIQYTCPYRDPLYAFMTVDLGNDAKVNDPISDQRVATITIEGRNSTWVGPSPAQLGKDMHPDLTDGEQIAPRIRSRVLTPRTASG